MFLKLLLTLSLVGGSLTSLDVHAGKLLPCDPKVSKTDPNNVGNVKEMKEYIRFCLNQQRASNILTLLHQEIQPLLTEASKGSYRTRVQSFEKNLPEIQKSLLQVEKLILEDLQMLQRIQNPNDIPLSLEEAINLLPEFTRFDHDILNDLDLDVTPIRSYAPKYRMSLIDYLDIKDAIENFGEGPSNFLPDLIQGILDGFNGASPEKAKP